MFEFTEMNFWAKRYVASTGSGRWIGREIPRLFLSSLEKCPLVLASWPETETCFKI